MGSIIYVTGGARSGKSTFAENYVTDKLVKKAYIATSIPFDNEMKMRVSNHKLQRGEKWLTIEAYNDIYKKLKESITNEKIILLDCLTNMISNIMIVDTNYDWDNITKKELELLEEIVKKEVEEIIQYVRETDIDLVVVSNEVGMGLVPPYALGRHFRDIAGRMNQLVANISDEAYLIVSGIKMKIK